MKDLVRPLQFYSDAMFGKLGRFLRILGFNVQIADVSLPDSRIMEICLNTERILITRDRLFYGLMTQKLAKLGWNPNYVIYSNNDQLDRQLADVFTALKLNPADYLWDIPANLPFRPRCSKCNGELLEVAKSQILGQIKEGTAAHHDLFWQCQNSGCAHIFWAGSHWDEIKNTLNRVIGILS